MKKLNSDQALQELMIGNIRYAGGKSIYPNQTVEHRTKAVKGQNPFAAVITCSDSRVSPEFIFDRGIGDLFVIRVAGNIVNDEILGSVEYAVKHLGVRLVMALGHTNCGAINAAVKGGYSESHIGSLLEAIKPAIEIAKNKPGVLTSNTTIVNIEMVVERLKSSEQIIGRLVENEKLKIIGALYDLNIGAVEIIK